jgi:hypothetical protein
MQYERWRLSQLPCPSWITAAKIIKIELTLQTSVVAHTGEARDQIRDECIQIGFMCTGLTREELAKVVREHTGYVPH